MQQWDKEGLEPVNISINVSRADVYNVNLVDTLLDLVKRYNIAPKRLHLEITESVYTESPEDIIQNLSLIHIFWARTLVTSCRTTVSASPTWQDSFA